MSQNKTKQFDICAYLGTDKKHLVQLALPREKLKKDPTFPLLASEKLDGVFAFAVCFEDSVRIFSRTGEEYLSIEHLKPELWEMADLADYEVIIFEAYAPGVEQPVISGWCRDTKNQHTKVKAYIHDAMYLEEFKGEQVPFNYNMRISSFRYCIPTGSYHHCHIIPQTEVKSWEEVDKLAESVWAMGGEGLILRDPNARYEPGKRNASIIKVKKGVSYDLEVIGFQEGTGRLKGTLGALLCRFRDGKTVVVGTGFTDTERRKWWDNQETMKGFIVQVDAMTESTKGVLREPRFKGVRADKTEADF